MRNHLVQKKPIGKNPNFKKELKAIGKNPKK